MRSLRKNNAITLIALVITIIVMLILVAVTITMAVNGGLFGYAGNAVRETESKKAEEQDYTNIPSGWTYENLITKYTSVSGTAEPVVTTYMADFYYEGTHYDIKFKEGQTWYQWATDTTNTADITLDSYPFSGETLKDLIKDAHNNGNEYIKYWYNHGVDCEGLVYDQNITDVNIDERIQANTTYKMYHVESFEEDPNPGKF